MAALQQGGRLTGEASTGTIKKVVENLPKFMEQQAKLSVHTSIAAEINGGVLVVAAARCTRLIAARGLKGVLVSRIVIRC